MIILLFVRGWVREWEWERGRERERGSVKLNYGGEIGGDVGDGVEVDGFGKFGGGVEIKWRRWSIWECVGFVYEFYGVCFFDRYVLNFYGVCVLESWKV